VDELGGLGEALQDVQISFNFGQKVFFLD